ncbi:MAG: hypothetical protein MJZ11_08130 [Lachnospiraceae bacterium]|nr:hypothetical protein [Lachnospiraceae bacterium]
MIRYNEKIESTDGFEMLYDWVERHCKPEDHKTVQILSYISGKYSVEEPEVEITYDWLEQKIEASDCKNGVQFFFSTQFCEISIYGSMWTYVNDANAGGENIRLIRIQ